MVVHFMASDVFNAHTDRTRSAPDSALTPMERGDLRWFFSGEAEASFGVCSNFGAMQHELARRAPSDEVLQELRAERRSRSNARRKRLKPDQYSLISIALAVLGAAINTDPAAYQHLDDAVPDWAREYMHLRGEVSSEEHPELLASDSVLAVVRQANHVRSRLVRVGSNWRDVLFAAYGPVARQAELDSAGFPDHPAKVLGSPSLVPIALAYLEWRREPGDPSGWEQLWSLGKTRNVIPMRGGEGRLTKLEETRTECERLWRSAVRAYADTRCVVAGVLGKDRCRRCP